MPSIHPRMTADALDPRQSPRRPSVDQAETGQVVADRYELGPTIGVGGFAEVFRAVDRLLDREVAVKLFATGAPGAERARQQRELQLLARMHHPNLVELYDAGEFQGRAFLVMRLIEGPSLGERLTRGPLSTEVAAAVGADLAAALDHVHGRGVTHRDVKPANVLLGERPMLSDFGISLLVGSTRITHSGYMIGTAAYMAPEQVRGDAVGPPADVYALGLVMLEMITGHPVYDGPPAEAAIARLSRRPAIPAALPLGLGGLLDRMTGDEPSSRPSAATVADELRHIATELHGGPLAVPAFLDTHQHTRNVARGTGGLPRPQRPSRPLASAAGHPGAVGAGNAAPPGADLSHRRLDRRGSVTSATTAAAAASSRASGVPGNPAPPSRAATASGRDGRILGRLRRQLVVAAGAVLLVVIVAGLLTLERFSASALPSQPATLDPRAAQRSADAGPGPGVPPLPVASAGPVGSLPLAPSAPASAPASASGVPAGPPPAATRLPGPERSGASRPQPSTASPRPGAQPSGRGGSSDNGPGAAAAGRTGQRAGTRSQLPPRPAPASPDPAAPATTSRPAPTSTAAPAPGAGPTPGSTEPSPIADEPVPTEN